MVGMVMDRINLILNARDNWGMPRLHLGIITAITLSAPSPIPAKHKLNPALQPPRPVLRLSAVWKKQLKMRPNPIGVAIKVTYNHTCD